MRASTLSGSSCGTMSSIRLRVISCCGRVKTSITAALLDDAAGVDHRHAVGHLLDHLHLVRDQHDRQAEVAVDLAQQARMERVVSGSSAEVASSDSSTLGRLASARAMPTRCFWPPLICAG